MDNIRKKLYLLQKGTMYGPDSLVRANQWIQEYSSKHGKELAVLGHMKLNGRMEMFACVFDPFQGRAHTLSFILPPQNVCRSIFSLNSGLHLLYARL